VRYVGSNSICPVCVARYRAELGEFRVLSSEFRVEEVAA